MISCDMLLSAIYKFGISFDSMSSMETLKDCRFEYDMAVLSMVEKGKLHEAPA